MNNAETNSASPQEVQEFVTSVNKRLNRHQFWNAMLWAGLLGGFTMLVIALVYVWPGYSVPTVWYPVVLGVSALAGLIAWFAGRSNSDRAAQFADEFFDLKDSVRSCVNFADEGHEGGFYELQSNKTKRMVEESPVEKIAYKPPYRVAVLAAMLILVAVSLGFKSPSSEVVERLKEEQATVQMTIAANDELKKEIDELEKGLEDEEERKLVEPNKLREWVDELKETTDRKEALRQYARLELKLNRASEALQQRQEEKLLEKIAEELEKDPAAKKIAEKLKQKDYEAAAKALKDLKPKPLAADDQKKLSEKRKELAKLKALARSMADASRSTRKTGSKKTSKSKKSKSGKPSDGKMAKESKNNGTESNSESEMEGDPSEAAQNELAQMIEELEEAVDDLDQEMEELELSELDENEEQDPEDWEECEDCEAGARARLDDLAKKLKKMAKKRKARSKLNQLSKRCSECQSSTMQMAQSRSPGGKKAGKGTDDSMREEKSEYADNDQNTRIKGLKGRGPSLTKVESADDGDGVSSRSHVAKQRDFKRQFESFVGREDVPEDLKAGVKNYFTNIHQGDDSETQEVVEEK